MGSFRSTPELKKHTIKNINGNISFAVSHMCGWRNYMEDAHISVSPMTNPKHSLFGVFDGHGGAEVAVFVERHFRKELEAHKKYKQQKYEEALRETFLKMDALLLKPEGKAEILAIQKQMKEIGNGPNEIEDSHAGCTANVILITPEFVYIANSGDSRSAASIKSKTVELSVDHKPEDPIETSRINKAGGEVVYGRVNGNLNLSRALGDLQYKSNADLPPESQMITANPDIKKIENKDFDFIIMGCDGIWEVKTNEQMIDWIRKRLDAKQDMGAILEELLDQLVAKDNSREHGMDNMSSILIKFG